MTTLFSDRVQETSTTAGTGSYVLAGAVAGFHTFASIPGIATGYVLELFVTDGTNWEVGSYTWNGTGLDRTTIQSSSNANAAVNWGSNAKTLANTLTATRLTGLMRGSTELDKRAPMPRRVAAKFGELQKGNLAAVRSVCFGDSLAGFKADFVVRELGARLGAQTAKQPTASSGGYSTSPYASIVSGTYGTTAGDLYSYWPTGPLSQIVTSSRVKYLYGGADPTFSRMKFYYVMEPGAGTMTVTVTPSGGAETTATTINAANASVALGVYEFVQTRGQTKIELIGISGVVRIIGVTETGTETGTYQFAVGLGGANLNDMMSGVNARALFTAFLTDYAPDLGFFEMDELLALSDLALYKACWATGQPTADKFFIATTPQVSIPTATDRRDRLQEWVASCDATHFFFDGWTPLAPYSMMQNYTWEGDGIHTSYIAQAYLASLMAKQFGFNDSVYGFSTRGVNTAPDVVSLFGSGTTIQSKNGGLVMTAEQTFGYDMNISLPRSLTFTTRVGGNGASGWCIAGTAGYNNAIPSNMKFDGSAGTWGFSSDTIGVYKRLNFYADTGGAVVKAAGLMFDTYLKTALPATPSNYTGMLIGVSNGSAAAGFCLAFSDGTIWRRVNDLVAV